MPGQVQKDRETTTGKLLLTSEDTTEVTIGVGLDQPSKPKKRSEEDLEVQAERINLDDTVRKERAPWKLEIDTSKWKQS